MHEMQSIITDEPWCLSVSLSRSSSQLNCAKMAEQNKILFGMNIPGGPWNMVLDRGPDPPTDRGRGRTFKFWDPLISPQRLKKQT